MTSAYLQQDLNFIINTDKVNLTERLRFARGSVRVNAISWKSCRPVEDTPDRMARDRLSFIYIMLTDNSNKEHPIMTLCCHSSCVDVLFRREKVEYCTNSTKLEASEQQCYRPISDN